MKLFSTSGTSTSLVSGRSLSWRLIFSDRESFPQVAASEREMLEVLCGDCALSSSGTGALRLLAEAKGRRVQISLMAYSPSMESGLVFLCDRWASICTCLYA